MNRWVFLTVTVGCYFLGLFNGVGMRQAEINDAYYAVEACLDGMEDAIDSVEAANQLFLALANANAIPPLANANEVALEAEP